MRHRGWITLALLLLMNSTAQGFDGKRHAAACQLAHQQLSSVLQARVQQLFTDSSITNLKAACRWPDQIKSRWRYQHTRRWHYINVIRSADQAIPAECSGGRCITQQLAEYWQQLQTQPDWQTLAFVSHLLADLHQPLHVSYADDAGGNRYPIWWYAPLITGLSQTNLHRYWDGQLLDERNLPRSSTKRVFRTCEQSCPKTYPNTLEDKRALINLWAGESLLLTRQIYQSLDSLQTNNKVNQQALPQTLRQQWRQQLQQRLLISSQRLHWLLSQTFTQSQ